MNELQIFYYESSKVRVYGKSWFVVADVCLILEIANVSDAVERLDDEKNDPQFNR